MRSQFSPSLAACSIVTSAMILIPRDILHTRSPSGLTLATTTSAPNLVRTSVMQVVSISSESSAMGTNTRFFFVDDPSVVALVDIFLVLVVKVKGDVNVASCRCCGIRIENALTSVVDDGLMLVASKVDVQMVNLAMNIDREGIFMMRSNEQRSKCQQNKIKMVQEIQMDDGSVKEKRYRRSYYNISTCIQLS